MFFQNNEAREAQKVSRRSLYKKVAMTNLHHAETLHFK